jgi:hypothetical protein
LFVTLHPLGRVVALAVFPGAEPQEYETQLALACGLNRKVYGTKVELALLRLDRFPIEGNLSGVGMPTRKDVQCLVEVLGIGRSGIVNLAPSIR